MKVYMAPMEGLTDYMFRNAYDEFFGRGKIDKYFMPFISPNQTEKFLAKEMRDISRDNNHINSIPQVMTNNSSDFIWTARMLYDQFGYDEINLNAGCPSGTVVSKDKGSGMLKNPDTLERILYEILSDNYIIDNAVLSLNFHFVCFPALGVLLALRTSLQAIGRKLLPIISSSLELIVKLIAGIWLIPRWGYWSVCLTEPIIWVSCALFLIIVFLIQKPFNIKEELNDRT